MSNKIMSSAGWAMAPGRGLAVPVCLVLAASCLPEGNDAASDPGVRLECTDAGCPVVLASGQDNPENIVVDSTSVYWLNWDPDCHAGAIMRLPLDGAGLDGGGPTPIVSGGNGLCPGSFAIDSTSVYWTDTRTIMKAPLDGGTPITLVSGLSEPRGIAVDSTSVYWAVPDKVMKVPLGGGDAIPIAVTEMSKVIAIYVSSVNLAVDATSVYWTDSFNRQVMKASLGGGTAVVIASFQNEPVGPVVDSTSVYWADLDTTGHVPSTLMKAPLEGGAATTLASVSSKQVTPWLLAIDAENLYWANMDKQVMKMPLGGGTPTTVASGFYSAWGIAVDATSVYWTDVVAGVVLKAPKGE